METSSTLVVLAVIMAVVELIAGAGLGWWLRGSQEPAASGQSPDELQKARTALSKLHELANRVAADVGEHSSRMQTISNELTNHAGDENGLDPVVLGTVTQIVEANERLQQQLKSAESKLQEQAHQIEVHAADAMTDALTGAPNRRRFDAELADRMAAWKSHGTPFCLMMVDVDHFKKFNDAHGHLAGDEVLRGVSRALRQKVRDSDIVARYGGEEFAVILPASALADAEKVVARACPYIEQSEFEFEGKQLKVTVSGGLAQARAGEDEPSLIKRADEALYAAKKGGRNCVFVHGGEAVRQIVPAAAAKGTEPKAGRTTTAGEPSSSEPRTDLQTGLPNRTGFCEEVRRRVAEAHRYESKLSLMMVKVDNFRNMSGRHGSPAEDLVLKTVSQFLSAGMREMDLVARFTEDVFSVLLPGTPLSQATGVAERLRTAVARCPLRGKDFELHVTVSTGAAEVLPGDDSAALLKRANAAMDAATAAGCDCTFIHNGKTAEPVSLKEATA
jgi:diguanylate cyclase